MGALGAQVSTAFTIAVSAPITTGVITNTASVMGLYPDLNPSDNTATTSTRVSTIDLMIDKTVDTGNRAILELGDPVTYTIHKPYIVTIT